MAQTIAEPIPERKPRGGGVSRAHLPHQTATSVASLSVPPLHQTRHAWSPERHEELILEPIRRDLPGSEAVNYALECIARWQREENTTPVKPADVVEIDRRIAKLDAQVTAGLLDREDIAPSLAALHDRHTAALAAAKRRTGNGIAFDTKTAATAYREAVEQMRELIAGPAA